MKYLSFILFCLLMDHLKANEQEAMLAEKLIEIIEPMGFLGAKHIPYNQTEIPIELTEIPDSRLIEMMAAYIQTRERNSPFSEYAIRTMFNAYPGLIRDDTKFRKLLSAETDARRFHLLGVNFLGRVSDDENATYIVEMAHMLLRDDPVCELRGEASRDPRFRDVSLMTYQIIISYLQKLDASFEEPPEDMPHAERKVILAQWLKANWPGCENLEIQTETLEPYSPVPGQQQQRIRKRPQESNDAQELEEQSELFDWRWLLGAIVLMVGLFGFLKMRKH